MATAPLDILLLVGQFEVRGSSTQTLNIAEHIAQLGMEEAAEKDLLDQPASAEAKSETKSKRERSRKIEVPPISVRIVCHNAARLSESQRQSLKLTQINPLAWPVVGTLGRRYFLSSVFDNPPSLIHIQGQSMHGLGKWLARRLNRPYVITLHRELTRRDSFRLDRTWGRRVVATSETIKRSVLGNTKTPPDFISVIRNGVVQPTNVSTDRILDGSHRPVIGTAGPLEISQGLGHFLKAIPQILAAGPGDGSDEGFEFLIAGAGPDERQLRQLARDLGIQSVTTFVSNLYDFSESLAAMDILCLPAERPGMGVTMLQAMARGVPVVTTDVGNISQVVQNGQNGILVPPADPAAIARAITALLKDAHQTRKIAAAGQQMVQDRYPLRNMLSDMLVVYRDAVAGEAAERLPITR